MVHGFSVKCTQGGKREITSKKGLNSKNLGRRSRGSRSGALLTAPFAWDPGRACFCAQGGCGRALGGVSSSWRNARWSCSLLRWALTASWVVLLAAAVALGGGMGPAPRGGSDTGNGVGCAPGAGRLPIGGGVVVVSCNSGGYRAASVPRLALLLGRPAGTSAQLRGAGRLARAQLRRLRPRSRRARQGPAAMLRAPLLPRPSTAALILAGGAAG